KLAFQKEHFSRRRHSRNCNSRYARKEKSVRASHSLPPNVSAAQWPPIEASFYIKCVVLKLLGGHFFAAHGPLSGVRRTCRFAAHMSPFDPKRTSLPKPYRL